MKIAYVTKQAPYGVSEAFILPEVADHRAHGWDVWFLPVAGGEMLHDPALLPQTLSGRLISPAILGGALVEFLLHPMRTTVLFSCMLRTQTPRLALRNLAVLPKGLWLGRRLKREGFQHIHIHFAAAPATLGVVAAYVANLPYSITAHRYDIAQNNLLGWKAEGARFLRAIDEPGAAEIRHHIGSRAKRVLVLHMGVAVPARTAPRRTGALATLRLAIAARLVAKKGHGPLFAAIALARSRGQAVSLTVFGDGPLGPALREQAQALGIAEAISWHGPCAHDALLEALLAGNFDAAVLPSLTTSDGDKEGIPVFLIEAMAAGLPVITTANGGIAELAGDGAGVMVPEGDVDALVAAMIRLARDGETRARFADAGRARVLAEFEIGACMERLRRLIEE